MFIKSALGIFGEAPGLEVNFAKPAIVMIRGDEEDVARVRDALPWTTERFPIKYLGLQLNIKQLTRSEWQPIVDDVLKLLSG